jgi:DNA end-binding protein Ku
MIEPPRSTGACRIWPAVAIGPRIVSSRSTTHSGNQRPDLTLIARIRYLKVDAYTGEEVSNEDIIKGYQVEKDRYLEVTKDKRENNADHRDRRVRAAERDRRPLPSPAYYFVPDGKVGHDAYAVIRETIRSLDKVALARLVLTNREHVMALEARDKGLMGMLLRYPYKVRDAAEYFDEIQDVKITKDMTISPST